MLLCRAGDGLVKLYADPELQRYFSHASSKNLYSDKAIFQPGAVRKVASVCDLVSVVIIIEKRTVWLDQYFPKRLWLSYNKGVNGYTRNSIFISRD